MLPQPSRDPNERISAANFYRHCLQQLQLHHINFLVGGGYAQTIYTGIARITRDLDIFILPEDCAAVMDVLANAGYRTELTFPHWLAKCFNGSYYLDIIFRSGNSLCAVDQEWFERAIEGEILRVPIKLVAPEEMIWTKAFVMERERFDGADVAHMINACAEVLDWDYLLRRFGDHWAILLAHVVLFGYIYPDKRSAIPRWVLTQLMAQLHSELDQEESANRHATCRGTLLSRAQYLADVELRGYHDPRLEPIGVMTAKEIDLWTQPIRE